MSRYRESVCKLCRNEGKKLYLKGTRCDSPKCAIERRSYPSGQHGQARKKVSEYGTQLRAKQRERRRYGVQEKQFVRYYAKAVRLKGPTGTVLFQLLESRFDNVMYRSGLIPSRQQARQMILHNHFLVNGKKVNIPSYEIKVNDIVTVAEKSQKLVKTLQEGRVVPQTPRWLEVDAGALAVKKLAKVEREDLDADLQDQMIIEYYSRN